MSHGTTKSGFMKEMAHKRSVEAPCPKIIDSGSPTHGMRFEVMVQNRHFIVHTHSEADGIVGYALELGLEEHGYYDTGPLSLHTVIKDQWSMPLDANDVKTVVKALEHALYEEEMSR